MGDHRRALWRSSTVRRERVNVLPASVILAAAVVFARGDRQLVGSRHRRDRRWRAEAFYLGLAALFIALEPPLDRLSDSLFWAHMLQHMLLQMVAPPLLVLGAPWLQIWRVVPLTARRRLSRVTIRSRPLRLLSRVLTRPWIASLLFLGTIALSHLPAIFDYALRHEAFHESEHILFIALGLLFWSRAFDSPPFRAPLRPRGAVLFFATAMAGESLLALAILGVHTPLYRPYAVIDPRPEGLSTLADQQFGAGLMLEPASLPLLFALLWSIKRWVEITAGPQTSEVQPLR
jgi:putative membrane protein